MGLALYADVSRFQGKIDWRKYAAWSRQGDGIARACIKATEGTGYVDPLFEANRRGALAAGIEMIIYYGYARPQWNAPKAEADWLAKVVGRLRDSDDLMLDYEEKVREATADWSYKWLAKQESNYGKIPIIYSYDAYIRQRLQDKRLAKYRLVLAKWSFHPTDRPPCPPPWSKYEFLQYSDKAIIPGIAGPVDADIYLGGEVEVSITIHTPGVGSEFDEIDAQHWRSKRSGKIIQHAMLADYKQYGNADKCGLTFLGHPMSEEIYYAPGKVKQHFQFGVRGWEEGKGCYSLPLYDPNSPGQDPRIAPLQKQVSDLQAQIKQLQEQPVQSPEIEQQISDLQSLVNHYQGLLQQINPLAQQITTLAQVHS
jgi:lysozyme